MLEDAAVHDNHIRLAANVQAPYGLLYQVRPAIARDCAAPPHHSVVSPTPLFYLFFPEPRYHAMPCSIVSRFFYLLPGHAHHHRVYLLHLETRTSSLLTCGLKNDTTQPANAHHTCLGPAFCMKNKRSPNMKAFFALYNLVSDLLNHKRTIL